jgi:hypothetical protein
MVLFTNEFTQQGWDFSLVDFEIFLKPPLANGTKAGVAVFKKTKRYGDKPEEIITKFETIVLRYYDERDVGAFSIKGGYHTPSTGEWGHYGFSYDTIGFAKNKFSELKKKFGVV